MVSKANLTFMLEHNYNPNGVFELTLPKTY